MAPRKRGTKAAAAAETSMAASSPAPTEGVEGPPTVGSGNEATDTIVVVDVDNNSAEGDGDHETNDEPAAKKAKKKSSPAWEHYNTVYKVVKINGKMVKEEWVKCKYCAYSARRNSRNGTSVFLNHTKAHNVVPRQQQLKLDKDSSTTSVETYRFKIKAIEYNMMRVYGKQSYHVPMEKFTTVVKQLYQEYASFYKTTIAQTTSVNAEPKESHTIEEADFDFMNYVYASRVDSGSDASDLDKYMAKPSLLVPNGDKFDVLSWWKAHKDVYPVLSLLARDVLSIQASTVASESAFSAGGHVIDPFRIKLEPEMVEALVCTKDWVAGCRRDPNKRVGSILHDLEVAKTLVANLTLAEIDDMKKQESSDDEE